MGRQDAVVCFFGEGCGGRSRGREDMRGKGGKEGGKSKENVDILHK